MKREILQETGILQQTTTVLKTGLLAEEIATSQIWKEKD
jgi:hypothetical protein